MDLVYADIICKNRPLLEFGQVHLQNSLECGQSSTYVSLHVLYHSTLVRALVRAVKSSIEYEPTVIAAFYEPSICSNDALHSSTKVLSIWFDALHMEPEVSSI